MNTPGEMPLAGVNNLSLLLRANQSSWITCRCMSVKCKTRHDPALPGSGVTSMTTQLPFLTDCHDDLSGLLSGKAVIATVKKITVE
jgi:hypothetical protein